MRRDHAASDASIRDYGIHLLECGVDEAAMRLACLEIALAEDAIDRPDGLFAAARKLYGWLNGFQVRDRDHALWCLRKAAAVDGSLTPQSLSRADDIIHRAAGYAAFVLGGEDEGRE